MKKLNVEQLENVQGGTFWGSGNCSPKEGTQRIFEHNGGVWECEQTWVCDFFMFWIPMYQVYEIGGCVFNY